MRFSSYLLLAVAMLTPSLARAEEKSDAALKAAALKQGAAALKQMAAKYDTNGDGNLDDEEKAKAADELKKRFQEGKLTKQEAAMVQAMMAQLQAAGGDRPQFGAGDRPQFGGGERDGFGGPANPGFNAPIPPDVLKKFDKNKDGQLDEKEMKLAKAALGPKKSRKEQLLDKLDLNGDGKITQEERDRVAAERKAEQEELKKAKSKKKTDKDDLKDDDKDAKEDKVEKEEKDAKEERADKDEK